MRRESSARRKARKRASWIPVGRDATRITCPCGASTCFACKASSDGQSEASQWSSVVISGHQWSSVVIRLAIRSITVVISGHQWSSEASLRCEYLCQVALYAVEGTPLSPQPPLGGCLIQPVDQDACMPAEERLTKHAALRSRLRSQSEALSEGKSIGSSVIKGSSVSAHLT